MTRLTAGGESCGNVVRVVGSVVIRLMARVAIRRNRRVIVVHVAHGTSDGRVGVVPSQRKWRVVVIERCRIPGSRAVADIALLGKSRSGMVRVIRGLVILQVAGNAGAAGQVVVVVHVTHGAGHSRIGVEARQRKSGA